MPRLLPILMLTLLLIGCDRGESDRTTVRLGYLANLTHAQAVLGVSSGDFAAAIAPMTLNAKAFGAGPALIEALFAGEIDLAYIGPGPALNAYARSRGQAVRIIAAAANNGVAIVAAKDSDIQTLADLAGHRIATPQRGNTQDLSARHYYQTTFNADPADHIVAIPNAEQPGLLARGQIDAAWSPQPWATLLITQSGGRLIAEEKSLWPDGEFNSTVVITTPQFLQSHPAIIESILATHCKWTRRLQNDPAATLPDLEAALFKLTQKKLPPGLLADAIESITFTNRPLPDTFSTYADWTFDAGLAKAPIDTANLIDTTLLDRIESTIP